VKGKGKGEGGGGREGGREGKGTINYSRIAGDGYRALSTLRPSSIIHEVNYPRGDKKEEERNGEGQRNVGSDVRVSRIASRDRREESSLDYRETRLARNCDSG